MPDTCPWIYGKINVAGTDTSSRHGYPRDRDQGLRTGHLTSAYTTPNEILQMPTYGGYVGVTTPALDSRAMGVPRGAVVMPSLPRSARVHGTTGASETHNLGA